MKRYVRQSTAGHGRQSLLLMLLCLFVTSCGQPDEAFGPVPTTSTQTSARPASAATPTLIGAQEDALLQADEEQWERDWATVEAGGSLPTPTPS